MSFSLSVANLDPSIDTLADRLREHAKREGGEVPSYAAKAHEAQTERAIALAVEAVHALMADHPANAPAPQRLSVRIAGHANWDGAATGAHIAIEIRAD